VSDVKQRIRQSGGCSAKRRTAAAFERRTGRKEGYKLQEISNRGGGRLRYVRSGEEESTGGGKERSDECNEAQMPGGSHEARLISTCGNSEKQERGKKGAISGPQEWRKSRGLSHHLQSERCMTWHIGASRGHRISPRWLPGKAHPEIRPDSKQRH
jgi:hypothetical protein